MIREMHLQKSMMHFWYEELFPYSYENDPSAEIVHILKMWFACVPFNPCPAEAGYTLPWQTV